MLGLIVPFLPHCRKRKMRPQALETLPARNPPDWPSVSVTGILFSSLSWSLLLSEVLGKPPKEGPGQWPWDPGGGKVKHCIRGGESPCGGHPTRTPSPITPPHCPCSFLVSPGVEGGFDLNEEKFEYDEDVKIVILPDYLEIARDGLGGLPDIVRDRVQIPSHPTEDSGAGGVRAAVWWASSRKAEDRGAGGVGTGSRL